MNTGPQGFIYDAANYTLLLIKLFILIHTVQMSDFVIVYKVTCIHVFYPVIIAFLHVMEYVTLLLYINFLVKYSRYSIGQFSIVQYSIVLVIID